MTILTVCWGIYQVAALGVGPQQAIPLKEMTRENLESQILACSGQEMATRAREFGAKLRADGSGVDKAVRWLEQYAASPLHPLNSAGSRDPPTEDGFFAWLPDTAVHTTSCLSSAVGRVLIEPSCV
jgi:hypothetical protein